MMKDSQLSWVCYQSISLSRYVLSESSKVIISVDDYDSMFFVDNVESDPPTNMLSPLICQSTK